MGKASSRPRRSDSCEAENGRVVAPATLRTCMESKKVLGLEQCCEFLSPHTVLETGILQRNQPDLQPELDMVTPISGFLDDLEFKEPGNLQLPEVELELPVTDLKEPTSFPSTSEEVEDLTDLVLSGVELEMPEMDEGALGHHAEGPVKTSEQPSFEPKPQASQLLEGDAITVEEPGSEDRPQTLHQRWKQYRKEAKRKQKEKVMKKYKKNWMEFEQRLEKLNTQVDKDIEAHQIREKQLMEYLRQKTKSPVDDEEPGILTELHQWWSKNLEELRVKRKERAKKKYRTNWEEFEQRLEGINAKADRRLARAADFYVSSKPR